MSPNTYNILVRVLAVGAAITFVLAIAYFVAAFAGWRGPYRKRRFVRSAILLGAIPLFVIAQQVLLWRVFLPSVAQQQRRERQTRTDAVSVAHRGDRAPPFGVTDTNGREFFLNDHRGKVVLVNFFATWCGPCLQELPHIQKLWNDKHDNSDFALIVIGREESTESVAAFQAKHGYTFPMAADPERSVYSLYAKEGIPRTYLVQPDGRICFTSTGFYEEDLNKLQKELDKQLRSIRSGNSRRLVPSARLSLSFGDKLTLQLHETVPDLLC